MLVTWPSQLGGASTWNEPPRARNKGSTITPPGPDLALSRSAHMKRFGSNADHGTRGLPDDGVGRRFQAPEDSRLRFAADHQKIGTQLRGDIRHDFRWLAAFQPYGCMGPYRVFEFLECAAGLGILRYMEKREIRLVFFGKVLSPVQHRAARYTQIHGTKNAPGSQCIETGCVLQMHPGPNRAIRVVQNLRAGRSQNQTPIDAHTLSGDHDQIDVMGGSAFDDFSRCFPMFNAPGDAKTVQIVAKEFVELPGRNLQIVKRGIVGRLNDVEENQFGLETSRERFDIGRRSAATVGKIDREKDALDLEHGS